MIGIVIFLLFKTIIFIFLVSYFSQSHRVKVRNCDQPAKGLEPPTCALLVRQRGVAPLSVIDNYPTTTYLLDDYLKCAALPIEPHRQVKQRAYNFPKPRAQTFPPHTSSARFALVSTRYVNRFKLDSVYFLSHKLAIKSLYSSCSKTKTKELPLIYTKQTRRFFLAGAIGFGPMNTGVKVPCLTAWRRAIREGSYPSICIYSITNFLLFVKFQIRYSSIKPGNTPSLVVLTINISIKSAEA